MVRPGRKTNQRNLEKEVLQLLQKEKSGLHFLAIFRRLHANGTVGSYSSLSRVLKQLVARKLLDVSRRAGRGIPKKLYRITDPDDARFELDRERLLSELADAKLYFSTQGQGDEIDVEQLPPAIQGPASFLSMKFKSQLQPWVADVVCFSNAPSYVQHILFDEGFNGKGASDIDQGLLYTDLPTFASSLFWRFVEISATLNGMDPSGPPIQAPLNEKIEWIRKAFDFSIIVATKLNGKQVLDAMKRDALNKYLNNPNEGTLERMKASITNLQTIGSNRPICRATFRHIEHVPSRKRS